MHGLNLAVPAGQVVGLLGPSGGGKSTLMRAIVGVQVVKSGTITVLGQPAGSPDARRRVGYTTQAPSVYGDLSAARNLAYFATAFGVRDVEDAVARTLDRVGLTDAADQRVETMSGGQQSRVSLAAGLVSDPELLVLDEPTVGLDPLLRRDLWDLFHRLADAGTTLLVSSHVMDEAARCDRLVLVREGHILADSTLPELFAATGTADVESAFLALVDHERPTPGERKP